MLHKFQINHSRKGFTLIELMIVVAIIGILAAIAIPQFAGYRRRGQNAAAQSALKNLATAQESYYIDQNKYTNLTTDLTKYGFSKDQNVTFLNIKTFTATPSGNPAWSASAKHTANGANTFVYDTSKGGLQKRTF